jgi:hypothetical protein
VKYVILTTGLILAAAAATWGLFFSMASEPEIHAARAEGDPMAWIRAEFKLSPEQATRIDMLHRNYGVVCAGHCREVQAALEAVSAAKANSSAEPERLAAAEHRLQEALATCERATEAHVREVAGCMPPDEGRRYLAMVLPRIHDYEHRGPPDLQLHTH